METNPIWIHHALEIAEQSARAAGAVLRDMLDTATVREKSPKDLVTDADLAAQSVLERMIVSAFPDHQFIGEETEAETLRAALADTSDAWKWVVDPLDGTANYAHGMHNFAVSIGLVRNTQVYAGVVYDPMSDEMYSAIRGGGATLNGNSIHASGCNDLNRALIAASFPPQLSRDSIEIQQFIEVLLASQSVRRLGSAALNLCYVAAGRLDAYWGGRLNAWDIAAGALLVQESGACLTDRSGAAFSPWSGGLIAAASPALHSQLLGCLTKVGPSRDAT